MSEQSLDFVRFQPFPAAIEPQKSLKATCIENDLDQNISQHDEQMENSRVTADKKIKSGGWSAAQNQVYLQFMIDNFTDFRNETSRRKLKVFYRLSKILKRRTPGQCRSHHQKLQIRYNDDMNAIIADVRRKIQYKLVKEYMNQNYRSYPLNFQLIKQEKKGEAEESQKGINVVQTIKEVLNFEWYTMTIGSGCIRLEINTESIQDYALK